jgi:2-polyprenyl-3-methyl-5-hydroxy-6-metoxy-1,4-benzoquinol methylase
MMGAHFPLNLCVICLKSPRLIGFLKLANDSSQAQSAACPLCAGWRFEELFVKRGETFVRCLECTLMMINPQPELAATSATYDEHYSEAYIRKAGKKLKRCAAWTKRLQRRFKADGRWLDVGCSAGFVVKAAQDLGFDAHGVEVEPAAVRWGQDTLNLANLRCGYLHEQHYASEHFNVISLYDVIEHVPDLNNLVREIYRILAPDGIIEIRTPDVGHWRTPRDLSNWKEVKPSEHLYYFNAKTLVKLFAAHRFQLAYRRPMLKTALDMYFKKA